MKIPAPTLEKEIIMGQNGTALGVAFSKPEFETVTTGDLTVTGTNTVATQAVTDLTVANDITIAAAGNVILDTVTGTKIGTTTSQKLGLFNAAPVAQQAATADLGTALSNLGIRAAGTAYPITTSGALALTGVVNTTNLTVTNDLTMGVGGNIILDTGTGTQIGTAVDQKLATYGQTPVAQASAIPAVTGAVSLTTTMNAILTVIRNFGLIA